MAVRAFAISYDSSRVISPVLQSEIMLSYARIGGKKADNVN